MTPDDKNTRPEKEKDKDEAIKPDPETLGTTDPQEHMEGPISSLVQRARETMEEDDEEDEDTEEKEGH